MVNKSIGQTFPVSATVQISPPYSIYLQDYVNPTIDPLKVHVLLKDLNQPYYDVRLHVKIESTGFSIQTKQHINVAPISIEGGVPTVLSAADLAPYFDVSNLVFSGISKSEFSKSGRLQEGFYRFSFTIVDYRRPEISLSNTTYSNIWIVQNEPPRINLPFCGSEILLTDPQSIVFQWSPMQMSPNGGLTTEYEFTLVEVRPEGRNPNDAINSISPLYQETTTFTNLFYGPSKPVLIPGQEYAFRIRASDTERADFFKNNGYSEVCTFIFGQDISLDPPTNFRAEAEAERRAKLSWDNEVDATEYEITYRKQGNNNSWFSTTTTDLQTMVNDLEPETAYEAKITSVMNSFRSDPSGIITFVTPARPEFTCGEEVVPNDVNMTPLPSAIRGSIFTVGKFEMQVLQIEGGDGRFTGYGSMLIPYLGARINCRFENIQVNINHEVIGGEVVALTQGVDQFVEELENDGNGGGEGEGGNAGDGTDDIEGQQNTIAGVIDTVMVNLTDSTITILTEDGTTEEFALGVTESNPSGNNIFEDEEGNVWVVDKDGGVKQMDSSGSPSPVGNDVFYTMIFLPDEEQKYGFDSYRETINIPDNNFETETIHDNQYSVSWKSVERGKIDVIRVRESGEITFPEQVRFKTSSAPANTYTLNNNDKEKQVEITGISTDSKEELIAYVVKKDAEENETEEIIGKLNIATYDKIRQKIIVVPVNSAKAPNLGQLTKELNSIYASAVTEWDVKLAPSFEINDDLLKGWDDEESGIFSSFPAPMQKFNKKFAREYDVDEDSYYIFLIDGNYSQRAGFMPFKRQFGYVYTGNTQSVAKTIAHELGHGAFHLRHTFSEFPSLAQGSTDNLMDYTTTGKKIYKYQWDKIHNPDNMISWFQNDEESEERCDWYSKLWAYFSPSELDLKIEGLQPLFEEVRVNFNRYFEDSKKGNINVNGFNGWTTRKASHGQKDGKYLAERAILQIIESSPSEITLNDKGVTLGKYSIEGTEYGVAAFSVNEKSNITKVEVDELCKLIDNEDVYVVVEDEFILINFFKDKEIELTLMIDEGGEDHAKVWMKHLLILVETPDWRDYVIEFWNNFNSQPAQEDNTCPTGFCCSECGSDLEMNMERFSVLFPNVSKNLNEYVSAFNVALQANNFSYNTCDRQAKIFSQIKVETNSLKATKEGEGKTWRLIGNNELLDYFKQTGKAKLRWYNQAFWETKLYKNFSQVYYYEKIGDGESIELNQRYTPQDSVWSYGYYNGNKQEHFLVKIPTSFKKDSLGNFKKYPSPTITQKFQIEKNIYNYAYGGNLGNGDHLTTDDGYNYRGKGAIQLTGKANYIALNNKLKNAPYNVFDIDIVSNPDAIADSAKLIIYSAFIHFEKQLENDINNLDILTINQVSALINTGNKNGQANHSSNRESIYLNLRTTLFKCKKDE